MTVPWRWPPATVNPAMRPGRVAPARPRRRKRIGRAVAILIVPALLCLAAMVFATTAIMHYSDDRAQADAKRAVVHTATAALITLWSYTPDNFDNLPERSAQYLSPDFQAQYAKFIGQISPANKQAQLINTAQVLGAGVESLSGSDATALAYVNSTSTTAETRDKPSLQYLSYRLFMQKHGSRWLIARMTTITSMDLAPKLPGAG